MKVQQKANLDRNEIPVSTIRSTMCGSTLKGTGINGEMHRTWVLIQRLKPTALVPWLIIARPVTQTSNIWTAMNGISSRWSPYRAHKMHVSNNDHKQMWMFIWDKLQFVTKWNKLLTLSHYKIHPTMIIWWYDINGKGTVKPLMEVFHDSYGVSLAIWDHTVLPATRHKWTHPALTPDM